ncbi:MAG: hypothetical protein KDB79_06345, partial [Acidobacteria bacterium]|nr:hypothetical protein [Acidobacteriota bacterium]
MRIRTAYFICLLILLVSNVVSAQDTPLKKNSRPVADKSDLESSKQNQKADPPVFFFEFEKP